MYEPVGGCITHRTFGNATVHASTVSFSLIEEDVSSSTSN